MRFNDGTAGQTDQPPAGLQKAAGFRSVDRLMPPVQHRVRAEGHERHAPWFAARTSNQEDHAVKSSPSPVYPERGEAARSARW